MIIDITFDPKIQRFDAQVAAILPVFTENTTAFRHLTAKPVLYYNFDDIELKNARDKVLRKKELKEIEKANRKLPDHKGAKKIIVFCNELHKSEQRYILYIYSAAGVKHSIKTFITSIIPELGFLNTDHHLQNKYFSLILNQAYSELFKEQIKYDANANSQQAIRR